MLHTKQSTRTICNSSGLLHVVCHEGVPEVVVEYRPHVLVIQPDQVDEAGSVFRRLEVPPNFVSPTGRLLIGHETASTHIILFRPPGVTRYH